MKKLLSLLAVMLVTLTAMAGETKSYYDLLHWEGPITGNENGRYDTSNTVEITDNEDGTYKIVIKDLVIWRSIGNVIFSSVPGQVEGNTIILSSNYERVDGVVEATGTTDAERRWDGAKCSMTVEGICRGDEAYLYLAGNFAGWSDDPFVLQFGTPMDRSAVEYKEKSSTTFAGATLERDNDVIELSITSDNKYKLTYKNFTYSKANIKMGDYVIEDLPVTEEADGLKSFSFSGNAKIQNLGEGATTGGFSEGQSVPMTISGKFNDTRMYANAQMCVIGAQMIPVVFGEDPSNWTPTAITGVNAETPADAQIFSVNGTRLSKMQKGINLIRANGKVRKVLVK